MEKLSGITLISEERAEQIFKHGYSVDHDVFENNYAQLQDAAIMLLRTDRHKLTPPSFWNEKIWKHMIDKSEKERLIISAALIAAEIDRIQALE